MDSLQFQPRKILFRPCGFGLLDLLITIAIFAIVTRSAYLGVSAIRESYCLRAALHSSLATFGFAAYYARRSGEPATLSANVGGNSIAILAEGSGQPIHTIKLPKGITISDISTGAVGLPNTIRLFPDGSATPAHFAFANSSQHQCTIFQSLRGARRWLCGDS